MAGSAAERAAEVVLTSMLEAINHRLNGINHRLNGATVTTEDEARWVVDALMADPDLLVDLAIEAGWLVHARNYKYPQEGAYICGTFAGWVDDETDEDGRVADGFYVPLYLRREAPDA